MAAHRSATPSFLLSLVLLLGCGPSAPPPPPPARAPHQDSAAPVPVSEIEVCKPHLAEGYWVGDCTSKWCIPGTISTVFSVNAGRMFAFFRGDLPAYAALPDAKECPDKGGAWRVFRVVENYEFVGANLFMFDPVRQCQGLVCSDRIEDGWAVSDPTRRFYDIVELPLPEFLAAHGPK